jgi:hypothetical protein
MFTQAQLDQAVVDAEASKDLIIDNLTYQANSGKR